MPIASANLEQLGQLVGADKLRTDADACERYRVDGLAPAAVVEPADAKELVEIVRWARAHSAPGGSASGGRAALLPVTSGAYLPLGNPPAALDVAVSLARLNRVLRYDPGDLTLSVEAGLPVARLDAMLSNDKLFVPAAVPYYERAALGGLVAANSNGPLRYAYGTWRDFVVGMKFVTGEGKLVKTGGRVVKNVAGYDLTKLLIGSLGSLGIITEINFKCFPLPPARGTFIASFPDAAGALALRDAVVHSALQPLIIELFDPAAARLLASDLLPREHWPLVIAVSGVERVIQRHEQELSRLAREARAVSFAAHTREHPAALWAAIRELIARARETNPRVSIVKCPLPLTQLGPFISKALQVAARYELPAAAHAHAGSGIAYIYLLPAPPTAGPPAEMTGANKRMAQAVTEMIHAGNNLGGRVTLPWCPTEVKRDVNVWGPLRDDFPLMQKLKAQFDPDRVLNPGRFLGGI